jgi:hypothetical protein
MKEHLYALLTFCATRGVAVTIEETEHSIELHLDSVIYSEGLNSGYLSRFFTICKSASRKRTSSLGNSILTELLPYA